MSLSVREEEEGVEEEKRIDGSCAVGERVGVV